VKLLHLTGVKKFSLTTVFYLLRLFYTHTPGIGIEVKNLIIQTMTDQKARVVVNFKKSKSLLEKIIKMVEEDRYCIEIMQQNLAVIGMLRSAHQKLMENHLQTCFTGAIESKNEKKKKQMIDEILAVTNLFNK
jgi:DNA-binding FrmR family transcriptional regulator